MDWIVEDAAVAVEDDSDSDIGLQTEIVDSASAAAVDDRSLIVTVCHCWLDSVT